MKTFQEKAKSVHWRINCFCNRKCPFCYGPEKMHEVKYEKSLPVLEKMLDYGINTFILTGGEPLLSKKVDKVLMYLKNAGAKIIMYSNCDFFDYHEDVLTECLDTLCIPVEGASEFVHDSVRGENSLRAIISVLDRYCLPSSPFKIKVGTVLGRHNMNELRAILYLLDKYKVDVWKIYEYIKYEDRDLQKKWDKNQLGITSEEYYNATQMIMNIPERKTPIAISSLYDRTQSYFMINPDLDIIIPLKNENGIYEDKILCSAIDTPMVEIEDKWRNNVDWEMYLKNLSISLF